MLFKLIVIIHRIVSIIICVLHLLFFSFMYIIIFFFFCCCLFYLFVCRPKAQTQHSPLSGSFLAQVQAQRWPFIQFIFWPNYTSQWSPMATFVFFPRTVLCMAFLHAAVEYLELGDCFRDCNCISWWMALYSYYLISSDTWWSLSIMTQKNDGESSPQLTVETGSAVLADVPKSSQILLSSKLKISRWNSTS